MSIALLNQNEIVTVAGGTHCPYCKHKQAEMVVAAFVGVGEKLIETGDPGAALLGGIIIVVGFAIGGAMIAKEHEEQERTHH